MFGPERRGAPVPVDQDFSRFPRRGRGGVPRNGGGGEEGGAGSRQRFTSCHADHLPAPCYQNLKPTVPNT